MEDYYGNAIGSYDGAGVLSSFINLKGYYPATKKLAVYFSLDLGAAFGVAGWAEGTEFHTSVGPGINWGNRKGSPRGDFSIRFQHMGTGTNAICSESASGSEQTQERRRPAGRLLFFIHVTGISVCG